MIAGGDAERARLRESPRDSDTWRLWGPYLAGRQWGTVREDYSADGDAWASFPFDHAHLRAYRWGEDGIAGISDRYGFLNLAVAMWNGQDDRLKERLFGLTNGQGNHGEDAKEYWWHLDATPTHSWAEYLYRYPQAAYPYGPLVEENARRGRDEDEFELADTGVLAEDRFFDVRVTHAKASPTDLLVQVTATNHGPAPAPLHLVPQVWFRNTWRWDADDRIPQIRHLTGAEAGPAGASVLELSHGLLGRYRCVAQGSPEVLLCDNETDAETLYGSTNASPFPKDGIGRAVVHGDRSHINPEGHGTKAGLHYAYEAVAPGESVTVRLRLTADPGAEDPLGPSYDAVMADRRAEADEFYASVIPAATSDDDRLTARRAFAGLLWCKQLYRYAVGEWLDGDPAMPRPPASRLAPEPFGRNTGWRHLYLADVISMPDEWEYPWFAAWDLAFHCVTLAHVDPDFAKDQLALLCREWAQHPDGQLPAYEWSFSDVNPPVHAWAVWQVYAIDGARDQDFLVRAFGKLLLNVGWWLNRKDVDGSNLFEGGFLGMDNISVFDRSRDVPAGWRLEQSDATSWMAFHCVSMLRIALELARHDPAWDDLATTFLERFVAISQAFSGFGSTNTTLWHEEDGFCYDTLVATDGSGRAEPVRVQSLVGLLPLLAVGNVPAWVGQELTDFTERLRWLRRTRPDQLDPLVRDRDGHLRLSLLPQDRYERLLAHLLDEGEFLSSYGIRSLSAAYADGYTLTVDGQSLSLSYEPGESRTGLFGGNSNWRGPVWLPVNMLLLDALRAWGQGVDEAIPWPPGSPGTATAAAVADAIDDRLIALFRPGPDGRRPGDQRDVGTGPLWEGLPMFSEYFHGDTGRGLGASHQTGWTALVAHLICRRGQ